MSFNRKARVSALRLGSLFFFLFTAAQAADPVLHASAPVLDRPTLTTLGLVLPITGDDNYNATATVRYRKTGATAWSNALPLFRVHTETVWPSWSISPQFAGSILDLRPSTTYEIEVRAEDPDGTYVTFALTGTTRAVPSDPVSVRSVNVSNAAQLTAALASAAPGDVINLANGVYPGPFAINASGMAQNPIVIRGASRDGTILDGQGCGCNVLEVYGAGYVHVEQLTLQNAQRGLRFMTAGAQGHVARRLRIRNVTLGIGYSANQLDFYIADNVLEGRLSWPQIYTNDDGLHSDDDGIVVQGMGHVVAHNQISGFGDAMKSGVRSVDFYGNDIRFTYDNGVELDSSEGNIRLQRNRFTNCFMPISTQPVLAGPAYVLRNLVYNSVSEQLKFHYRGSVPPAEPNGILVYNNTFVSPYLALTMQGAGTSHNFRIENNLFIGPAQTQYGYTVDWYGQVENAVFNYNGYYPDGQFSIGRTWAGNFATLKNSGLETSGMLLNGPAVFASGIVGPTIHDPLYAPPDLSLAAGSQALDRARLLSNVNDVYTGAAPDLGALESGCPQPIYGPRPEGMDESNEPFGCVSTPTPTATTTVVGIPASAVYSPNPQPVSLTATVTASSGTVNAGSVQFLVNNTSIGSANVVNGNAKLDYTIPAGTHAGSALAVVGQYSGTTQLAASTSASVNLTIAKATPVITWPKPADIYLGTPLSLTQLNASSDVPGSFSYNPPLGKALPVGNGQTLTTLFTPSNSLDYNTGAASVTINVLPAASPVGAAPLRVTWQVQRVGSAVQVSLYLSNTGSTTISNVRITAATLGGFPASQMPANVGNIAAGAAAFTVLSFDPAPAPGTRILSLTGVSDSGNFGGSYKIGI